MTAGAPWSVKGIDPKARRVAKDLARRSGMTLGEWLNHVILEDDVPEEVASEADLPARPIRMLGSARPKLAAVAAAPGDEFGRVASALDRLTDRIEASETRTGLAIAGIEHSVRQAVARIEAAEREQLAVCARIDTLADRLDAGPAPLEAGPRSAEALHALYGDEVQIPGEGVSVVDDLVARLGARLADAEAGTARALESLKDSLGALESRLRAVEGGAGGDIGERLEALADDLGRRVEEARAEAAARLQGAPDGRIEAQLAQMARQVAAAEQRSARAIETMGHEVLALAEALNRRLQGAEQQSARAIEQVGGEIVRIGAVLENRLARAEEAQSATLERLGAEIGSAAERLTERVIASERRAAQAIDDVGEQVAKVTERMEHRHERLSTDLAERLRESEARTVALLDEARAKIADQLAGTGARLSALADDPPPAHPFGPELFARAEPDDEPAEEPPAALGAFEGFEDFTPLSEPEDELAFADPREPPPEVEERRPLSTREVIEQARVAARAAGDVAPPAAAERRAPPPRGGRRMLGRLGFRSQIRPASTWQTALMVAGGAAFLSVGAAGVVLMEGPGQAPVVQEAQVAPADVGAEPRAAVALAPQPLGVTAPAPATLTPAAPERPVISASAYAEAVRDVEASKAGGLSHLKQIADGGYAPAQFYLAKLYETGQFGVVKNPAQARRWTEAAAEGGDRSAMHNLALYYFRGEGGPLDLAQAAAWFRRAAEAGVVDSQYNLGLLYQSGSGVDRDLAQAYKWFSIAANGGDGQARAAAVDLEAKLAPSALSAAEKQVAAFRPRSEIAAQASVDTGTTVATVQRILGRLGYYSGPANGTPTPDLKVAVAAYQKDHGLAATGALDPNTVSKLSVFNR